MNYDFAGWATKNDLTCSDGLVIRHGAFRHNDGKKVPLVWQHNSHEIKNILGSVNLKHTDEGVYAYATFNESEEAGVAKGLLKHGDITHLSIGASKIKRNGSNVVHGDIYEVSLVLAGANPGALIESVLVHGESEERAILYTEELLHTDESVLEFTETTEEPTTEEQTIEHKAKTVGDVLSTLSEEQKDMMAFVIGQVAQKTGGKDMKHNIFEGSQEGGEDTIQHSQILADAVRLGSLRESVLQHGITSLDSLFPDAKSLNGAPVVYNHNKLAVSTIIGGVSKSPFSRIKTSHADLTVETARARGYIKGTQKLDQVYGVLTRTTTPTTIYVKQTLDRDDILDITDFDVVSWANQLMRLKLEEEIARAILVGDGRPVNHDDKVNEDNMRPIVSDDDLYTIKKTYDITKIHSLIEVAVKTRKEYRGAGQPTMFVHPDVLADLKLMRDVNGRFLLTNGLATEEAIKSLFSVSAVVECDFLEAGAVLMVNLSDYHVGSSKGGQITSFEDFDIDYNKHKYLMETRASGALKTPKSAMYFTGVNPSAARTFSNESKTEAE